MTTRTGRASRLAILLVGFAVAIPGTRGWAQETDFAVALEAAKKAASAEPLSSYLAGPFNDLFGAKYIEWINECTVKTNQSSDPLLEMLVTVSPTGAVEAVRYQPQSKHAGCFAELLRAAKFAAPPARLVVPAVIREPK
jgi:hypothetical protein